MCCLDGQDRQVIALLWVLRIRQSKDKAEHSTFIGFDLCVTRTG
ncbi:unnamed protein product [Periconia digitata]|uniref:Uncharacterized protein n=1 Tax=Periconia digitata TaxID=1303443 RepID=A0A9W4XFU1_9PLEO|nr:unnamed protein product [Periconia digitata]